METNKEEEVHIICKVHCEEQNRENVIKLMLELVEPARQEPGCLYYDIYQERDDLNALYILDGWVNQEAVEAHIKHPNVPKVMAQLRPLMQEDQKLTLGRRISDMPLRKTEKLEENRI